MVLGLVGSFFQNVFLILSRLIHISLLFKLGVYMDSKVIKQDISDYIDSKHEYLWNLSNYLFDNAEIGFNEYKILM